MRLPLSLRAWTRVHRGVVPYSLGATSFFSPFAFPGLCPDHGQSRSNAPALLTTNSPIGNWPVAVKAPAVPDGVEVRGYSGVEAVAELMVAGMLTDWPS